MSAKAATPKKQSILNVALVGQPNVGKTTLFNALCGLRAHTSNIPGTTVDARFGRHGDMRVMDLPGFWSLHLDQPEAALARQHLTSEHDAPDVVVLVLDAADIRRGLHVATEVLPSGVPTVVALTMTDVARRRGLDIDPDRLADWLGCPVVPVSSHKRIGIHSLTEAIRAAAPCEASMPALEDEAATNAWVDGVVRASVPSMDDPRRDRFSDRLDMAFTHPVLGVVFFLAIMLGVFWSIFALASVPMDLIELIFGHVGGWISSILPPGPVQELIVDGVVGGLAGTIVFLPQIVLLFFLISILEDTGYLARAAFVMDRILRVFGLPGQAFVPMLSAHACAIPAIMSTRLVPDRRDRLAIILVAPFLSCAARLPVYVLLIGFLFAHSPVAAALSFAGAYALGLIAALLSAMLARRTVLKGPAQPMVISLPPWQFPSLWSACLTCWDRGFLFLRKAGTVILAMVIVLWWLSAYPKAPEPSHIETADTAQIEMENPMAYSFAGRIGRAVQPAFEPLGWDWQLSVGVMTSFAAREVFVSTMAVLVAGSDDTDDDAVITRIHEARTDDGQPMLTPASASSLLVFFILAMQCLPTLAITAREAGGWKWAVLQFGWMSALAWIAAWIVYQCVSMSGVA